MSINTLYIDSNDEITNVIEKLKGSHEPIVALVIPKGSPLIQSIVNLKLAKKAAGDAQKDIILVTTDTIGRNLATQVGIPVASNEKEVSKVASGQAGADANEQEAQVIAGVRIHRYYDEDDGTTDEAEALTPEEPVAAAPAMIVPKAMLQEEKPVEPAKPVATAEPLTRSKIAEPAPEPIPTPTPVPTPVAVPVVAPKVEKVSKPVAPVEDKPKTPLSTKKKLFYGVGGGILAILVVLALLLLPLTTVILTVKASPWEQAVQVTASASTTGVSADGTQVPAEMLTQEGSATVTITATGSKEVGESAKGNVDLYNFDSTNAQSVPAGTTISASGQQFTTQAAVSVPGFTQPNPTTRNPGHATVAVTANAPGTSSNLTDASITPIQTSGGVSLSGKITTTGGTSKTITFLSAADITNGKKTAETALRTQLGTQLSDALKNRDVISQDGADVVTVGEFTTVSAVNAEVTTSDATLVGKIERLVVDQARLTEAVANFFKDKQVANETRIVQGFDGTSITTNATAKTAAINLTARGKLSPVFSTSDLPANLTGRSILSAREYISNNTPASNIEVTQSPRFWPIKKLPRLSRQITIEIQYE